MAPLIIRIKKKPDGSAALTCMRPDGSTTWQRQDGKLGRFFPLHDLTHYAVETCLGHRRGFYGLVADGWDVTDFGAPWPKGPLPPDLDPSELIVGFFDLERATGFAWSAADFNEKLAGALGPKAPTRPITEADLARIRTRMEELFGRWAALEAGGTLELEYG